MKYVGLYIGAGVVAVASIGVILYEVLGKKTAAPATGATLLPTPPTPVGTIIPLRPVASIGTGTFSANPPPPGAILTMVPNGALSAPLSPTSPNVTLELPAGAQWVSVATGNSAHPNTPVTLIDLNGNTDSPIALTENNMVGANMIVAKWSDSHGTYLTTVSTPLIVSVKPLTLHL